MIEPDRIEFGEAGKPIPAPGQILLNIKRIGVYDSEREIKG